MISTVPYSNSGAQCELEPDADRVREHIEPCTCSNHTGVCEVCGNRVTVGPSGLEYGHALSGGRQRKATCPHRPTFGRGKGVER